MPTCPNCGKRVAYDGGGMYCCINCDWQSEPPVKEDEDDETEDA